MPLEGLLAVASKVDPKLGLSGLVDLEKRKTDFGKDTPAAVREWEYLKSQFPNMKIDFPTYLSVKRSGYTVGDVGGVPTMRPVIQGLPAIPLTTLHQEATGQSTIAGAKKGAEVKSGAQAQSQIDLGSNLDEINKMRQEVTGLVGSRGFDTIYGLSGKVDPRNYIPGTDAANAEARRSQLEAASFGIAIQKMRGLGQLSDAEGKKVTAAYTRAIDKKQSPEAAKEAWSEVQTYLDLAEKRAKEKAGFRPKSDPLGLFP
jgi:hypothetical protein